MVLLVIGLITSADPCMNNLEHDFLLPSTMKTFHLHAEEDDEMEAGKRWLIVEVLLETWPLWISISPSGTVDTR